MLTAVVLTGCAAGPAAHRADASQALGSIEQALDRSASAVATGSLVIGLHDRGDLPAVTADVTIGDAVDTADAALHELSTIVVPDPSTEAIRAEAIQAAGEATVVLTSIRTWLGGRSSTDSAELSQALGLAETHLTQLSDAVDTAIEARP